MNLLKHLAQAILAAIPALFHKAVAAAVSIQDNSLPVATGKEKHDYLTENILERFSKQLDELGPLAHPVARIIAQAAYLEAKTRFPELFIVIEAVAKEAAPEAQPLPQAPAPAPGPRVLKTLLAQPGTA